MKLRIYTYLHVKLYTCKVQWHFSYIVCTCTCLHYCIVCAVQKLLIVAGIIIH